MCPKASPATGSLTKVRAGPLRLEQLCWMHLQSLTLAVGRFDQLGELGISNVQGKGITNYEAKFLQDILFGSGSSVGVPVEPLYSRDICAHFLSNNSSLQEVSIDMLHEGT